MPESLGHCAYHCVDVWYDCHVVHVEEEGHPALHQCVCGQGSVSYIALCGEFSLTQTKSHLSVGIPQPRKELIGVVSSEAAMYWGN